MITKNILILKVGTSTMFEHFKSLAKDIPSIANDPAVQRLTQTIPLNNREIFYLTFFRNARILDMIKNSSNGSFLERFDSFKKTKNILSYSFVRHPFER